MQRIVPIVFVLLSACSAGIDPDELGEIDAYGFHINTASTTPDGEEHSVVTLVACDGPKQIRKDDRIISINGLMMNRKDKEGLMPLMLFVSGKETLTFVVERKGEDKPVETEAVTISPRKYQGPWTCERGMS